jgi:hypothetical protein
MRSAIELGLRAFEAEDLGALSGAELAASLGEERRAIDRLEATSAAAWRALMRRVDLRPAEPWTQSPG